MKKLVTLWVLLFGTVLFVNCTDNSLEELKNNEKHSHTKQGSNEYIDPGADGSLDDEEEEEDGTAYP
jgi:hypothetical protein